MEFDYTEAAKKFIPDLEGELKVKFTPSVKLDYQMNLYELLEVIQNLSGNKQLNEKQWEAFKSMVMTDVEYLLDLKIMELKSLTRD